MMKLISMPIYGPAIRLDRPSARASRAVVCRLPGRRRR
jgi:hypothetical protein